MVEIFGSNFFEHGELKNYFNELVGLSKHKPFECVGTEEEAKLAAALSINNYRQGGNNIPSVLLELEKDLSLDDPNLVKNLEEKVKNGWGDENFLPAKHLHLLKEVLAQSLHLW